MTTSQRQQIVVKIGGNVLGPRDTTFADLVELQRRRLAPVVVHGGGPAISGWLKRLGVETTFVDGLRVTNEETLDVVTAVLSGLVNKSIVTALQQAGGRAAGISGVDGSTILARVRTAALGRVGEVSSVDLALLTAIAGAGMIPVVSPVSREEGAQGTLLNVNADSVAGAIARALGADRVLFLTDVPGVMDSDGTTIAKLSVSGARDLIKRGVVTGGMVPKVEACLAALEHVDLAQIVDGRMPSALLNALDGQIGTRIERNLQFAE